MKRRGTFGGLQWRIMWRLVLVGLLPVVVVGGVAYYGLTRLIATGDEALSDSRNALVEELVGQKVQSQATTVAREIEVFLRERVADLSVWVSAPVVIDAARRAQLEHAKLGLSNLSVNAIETRFELDKELGLALGAGEFLKRQVTGSAYFGEAFFTEANGFNVALTNPTSDFVQSDEAWWKRAWVDGVHLGDVEFDESANIWSLEIAVRIDNPSDGAALGVLKAVLSVSAIQALTDRHTDLGSRVSVANASGKLVAETSSGHARDRIMSDEVNLRRASTEVRVAFGSERSGYHVGEEWLVGYNRVGSTIAPERSPLADSLDWVVTVMLPLNVALAPLRQLEVQQAELANTRNQVVTWLLVAAIAMILVALLVAQLISRQVTGPVRRLGALAEDVSLGNTRTRIELDTNDEFEDLAESLERMRRSLNLADRLFGPKPGERPALSQGGQGLGP